MLGAGKTFATLDSWVSSVSSRQKNVNSEASATSQMLAVLSGARAGISWRCTRIVHVDGYEGEMSLDELASTQTQIGSLASRRIGAELKVRHAAVRLRLQALYQQSDAALQKTWVYRYIVPEFEFPDCCIMSTRSRVCPKKSKEGVPVFEFDAQDFDTLWPEQTPISNPNAQPGKKTASGAMVEQAVHRLDVAMLQAAGNQK